MNKSILLLLFIVFFNSFNYGCNDSGKLHPEIRKIYNDYTYGSMCQKPEYCGNLVSINCGAEVDGPLNYYNNQTGEVIMYCGGSCMGADLKDPKACKSCPPKEWKCKNKNR